PPGLRLRSSAVGRFSFRRRTPTAFSVRPVRAATSAARPAGPAPPGGQPSFRRGGRMPCRCPALTGVQRTETDERITSRMHCPALGSEGPVVPRESTMKTQLVTALAVWLLLGAGAARADEKTDAKALLDRATKAMNGEGKLVKYGTGTLKGKLTIPEGGGDISGTVAGTWQGLSQYRVDADGQDGGKTFKAALGINGEKVWFKREEKMDEGPEGAVPFLHNIFHAGRMPVLLPSLTD